MTLSETITPKLPPLQQDPNGVYRIRGTRVTLATVIEAYLAGATPEEIVETFDSLRLPDVYAVIAHYLENRAEVDDYMAQRSREQDEIRRRIDEAGHRDALRRKIRQRAAEREGR